MQVTAIIPAAGQGTRVSAALPKQLADLGDGSTMLVRSLKAIGACPLINAIVVAVPAELPRNWPADITGTPVAWVRGGARRQDSVANALAQIGDGADIVVIHDAARPFVSVDLIERTIRAAEAHGAAIAALPVSDTVKQAGPSAANGTRVIRATLPREAIYLAQTPQAFRRDILAQAIAAAAEVTATDEATLVERAGFDVHLVEGDAGNFKVTTPDDFARARAIIAGGVRSPLIRIGTGYDLHRLVEGRRLILAGEHIPYERGLVGHSDADIVCHAVTDAVLGAAALGDIGRFFPDTRPEWKDADSIDLLKAAMRAVHAAGFVVGNVDVTVIAERPKLLPHVDRMRANLAAALGCGVPAVSVKGKTNENVGAIGRGEAMACHAVALLHQR